MPLLETIETDLLSAIKSGDQFGRDTLRYLKSALKNAEIALQKPLDDEAAITAVQKEVKRRAEAIESYKTANKPDLAEQEAKEMALLQKYLPAQMSEAEITAKVTEVIAQNPEAAQNRGLLMGKLSAELKGRADMGLVAKIVAQQLAS